MSTTAITDRDKQRFWKHVAKASNEECWLWMASVGTYGYGQLKIGEGPMGTHRISFLINRGEIPNGLCVLHKCDVRACVNPSHLFLGTKGDNSIDRDQKGRGNQPKGTKVATAKLSEADVIHIRARYLAGGCTTRSLAIEHGVDGKTIHAIIQRRTWKHL